MTTPERRQRLYSKIMRFMDECKVDSIPINIQALCAKIGVDLVPLSDIVQTTGLTEEQVFSIWGNEDGAVNCYRNKERIAFNDRMPSGRIRFTLCEELAHIIYGHTEDPGFNVFRQDYTSQKYKQYEEEARLGAGFLICHPKFFYAYEHILPPAQLAEVCGITIPCATTRHEVMLRYRSEIRNNIAYRFSEIPTTTADLEQLEREAKYRTRRKISIMP